MENARVVRETGTAETRVQQVLDALASRRTVRAYVNELIDRDTIDAIIRDGMNAPTSCNHQMWHYVVVCEQEKKDRLQKLSGSNEHFTSSGAIVILCFHMGWNHNKFAVVQSVAAAAYHMSLSAHLRGYGASWNAGIGNGEKVKALLGIPAQFEVIGAVCIGAPAPGAPRLTPPRRPLEAVRSYERFERPPEQIYPLAGEPPYSYWEMKNHANRRAVFDPGRWGWDRIADFRGYAVYAKSPLPGVYVSRRLGREMPVEAAMVGGSAGGRRVLEVMPYGGSYSVLLRRRMADDAELHVADLSDNNLMFVRERIQQELGHDDNVFYHRMERGRLPFADDALDAVFLPQILEAVPDRAGLLDEIRRVLRPGGTLALSFRNAWSWFGVYFWKNVRHTQVPNFGPYRPLSPLRVRAALRARFTPDERFGISPSPWTIGAVRRGLRGRFCRLEASVWRKP